MVGFKLAALPLVLAFNWAAALSPLQLAYQRMQALPQQRLPADTDVDPSLLYPAYNLSVPIDHFHNDSQYEPHSDAKFPLRYWFDATYYKPGGPVIVLAAGETDGEGRLPFLQKGIVYQLAKATNGLGVILEHRYYGTSLPTDFSTKNLRFLTTDQALADSAYFAKNVVFKGLENAKLTAPSTKWIVYGGSYAGGFAAFLRKLYPDVFFGGISSSGVTEAIWDYWQYFEPIRKYGPQNCIKAQQNMIDVVDHIYFKNKTYVPQLKSVFGLQNVQHFDDFASVLTNGVYGWQGRNWDPEVNDPSFYEFCGNFTSSKFLFPQNGDSIKLVKDVIAAGGHSKDSSTLTTQILNFAGWLNQNYVAPCASRNRTQEQCFGQRNLSWYTDINDANRAWPYQYCTQWGYLQTGSGYPKNIKPILSRAVDLEWNTIVCREAFNLTKPANLTAINKYGGFGIRYPRLAHLAGETDPWRPASALAEEVPQPPSTVSEPRIVIKGAVHHWDENGRFPNETTPDLPPQPVRDAQKQLRDVVVAWLKGYH